ncbi:site-specific integrase [Vibrio parahaemolyticus]|uniref:site-specific integrase n=1 Tax=Vibrio parahaemolyticus TaxID=670 RepID=UPI00146B8695|nr:site-specific integrase [Vibrio parahaemolyticus]MDF5173170.1 site-specific integrase [Vibrio parahaemolyticus]NMS38575.1 site-specific integrase [Vibrio parahaemolyticus]
MATYTIETLVFENGERYPILMGEEAMPHFHVTLWVTSKLRSVGKAENTITNKINHVKWFLGWQEKEQRDLYAEFQKGVFLSEKDIESIKSYLALDIHHLKGVKRKVSKGRNKVVNMIDEPKLIEVMPSVGRNHHYNRMTSVIEYLTFLAKLAVNRTVNEKLNRSINQMEKQFKAARPKGKGKNVQDEANSKSIPDGLVLEFMAVAHFEHPKNPFKNKKIRLRNHLMFHLMDKHGIRRGEMLSLMLTDMTLHGDKKSIWVRRTHDDKNDSRTNQPVAKTKERMLRISNETAELLSHYIIECRAKTPNANKHPYLFVTHRKCSTQGQPVSESTFDNTIVPAMKAVDARFEVIHPHYFRHNWNEGFSEKVDKNNELAALGVTGHKHIDSGTEAKMRKHQMGHSSESSGNVYNQRHVNRKANEVSLMEQEDLQKKAAEARKELEKNGDSNE